MCAPADSASCLGWRGVEEGSPRRGRGRGRGSEARCASGRGGWPERDGGRNDGRLKRRDGERSRGWIDERLRGRAAESMGWNEGGSPRTVCILLA